MFDDRVILSFEMGLLDKHDETPFGYVGFLKI
jgi:hypothetical protein